MNIFYVYGYYREDGTPYYIGKGKGARAWSPQHTVKPPKDSSLIKILFDGLSEIDAFCIEVCTIALWGRRDNGTGILRNLTDGGEGISGLKASPERKAQLSVQMKTEWANGSRAHVNKKTAITRRANGWKGAMYGLKHSAQTKQQMSESAKKRVFGPLSDETKARMATAQRARRLREASR